MSPSTPEKMNTKYTGHHISAGGFVFFEDTTRKDRQIYVALIKNKYNQWWIAKGHIEEWESHAQCAYREIEEELGLPQSELEFIDFCHLDSYTYDENGQTNTKDLYINIFNTKTKFELIKYTEEVDQLEVAWVTYERALEIIAFNKKELIRSKEIFDQRHRLKKIENTSLGQVRQKLLQQKFIKDIGCFILYGSYLENFNFNRKPDDTDICIVANNRHIDLELVAEFIFDNFENPDFRVYFKDEVESKLDFVEVGVGLFSLEYFAHGFSLYGENIFKEKIKNIDKQKYIASHLNKIFEYFLRIRREYMSKKNTYEYKRRYVSKYVIRLLRSILLATGLATYVQLQNLTKEQIVDMAKKEGIVKQDFIVNFDSTKELYYLFEEINEYVIKKYS